MRGFFAAVFVLLIIAVGLGFYLHWFGVSVDKEKMNEDLTVAKADIKGVEKGIENKVHSAKDGSATTASGGQTATGKVSKVELADDRFQMTTTDNKDVTIYLDASSKVRLKGAESKLEALEREDEVKVAYDIKDGKNLATSVTANRK